MPCLSRSELRLLGLDAPSARLPFEEPGVAPNYAPSRAGRITRAALRVSLDPVGRRWEGRITVTFEALARYTGTLRLDAEDLEIERVEGPDGEALPWRLEERALAVQAGALRTVTVAFRGRDPRAGLYFVGPDAAHPDRSLQAWTQCQDEDAHLVFPCHDHPRAKHPWTVEIEGPEGWVLLGNGRRVRHETRDGRQIAVWEQADPMPAYLLTVVAAPLDVHDGGVAGEAGVPVRYLVPPGTPADRVTRAMGRTPEMIAAFEAWSGVAYPWPRYDQVVVHDFVFGGMENTAATTMTELLLVDARVGPHWDAEGLVAHELAHQWFGDFVTCQDWSQAWLNESFATFLETVWEEHAHGPERAAWLAFEQLRAYLTEDGGRYRRAIESYGFVEPIDVFDRHLYEKGAVVLRTLRAELGSDAFRAGVRLYLTRHAHDTVHARHLQRALEDATGVTLDGFFTRWVRTPGHPELTVEVRIEADTVTVEVSQTQGGEGVPEVWPLKLPVEVVDEDGARRVVLDVRTRSATHHVATRGRAQAVAVDPTFDALAVVTLQGDVAWLAACAQDPRPVLAARAIAALADKSGRAARDAIVGALRAHPHPGVRADAVAAWGGLGAGDDGLDVLCAVLTDASQDPRVRVAAARAIGARRTDAAAAALRGVLDGDVGALTWHLVGEVLTALGATRAPGVVEALVPWLDAPSWGDTIARGALAGLAATHEASALDPLVAFIEGARDDRAVAGAAVALGRLAEVVPSVRRPAREALERLARTGGFRTQVAAVDALGTAADPDALPVLRTLHAQAPDGRVRRGAWESIARLQRGRDVPTAVVRALSRIDAVEAAQKSLASRVDALGPRGG